MAAGPGGWRSGGYLLAAAATLSAIDDQLSFTRTTIGAVLTGAPSNGREVLLDDESYLFVADSRRLLVYGKQQQRWLWIETLGLSRRSLTGRIAWTSA